MFKRTHNASISPEDHVPLGQKLAYGIGGPVDILGIWVLVNMAYQVFNMELGVSFTGVALILMALRLWDGIIDPIMGWISDNTRSRWGRRRPYILIGAVLCGLTYPLIWWFPKGLSEPQLLAWVIGFGILFYTCFTIWAMPWASLIMEMTPDYNERTRVAAIRGYMQSISSLVVGFSWTIARMPMFADPETGLVSESHAMRTISIVIGLILFVCGIVPALFVKERYYEHVSTHYKEKVSLIKGLKETLSNKPFILLTFFTLFFVMGTNIYDSYGRYVGTYYVLEGDKDMAAKFMAYGTVIYMATSVALISIFRWVSERIGKIKALQIATVTVLVAALSTWFTFNPDYPYLQLLNTVFIGAGYAGLWLMVSSMQADIMDYDELKTGERREGSFASIFSWVLKLSFCAGFMASGPILQTTGFDYALEENQPAEVFMKMRIGFVAVPTVALLIAVFLLKKFTITPEKAHEIRTQLEAKRGVV